MYQTTQLQFRLLTPEAQRAAIQRLALRGAGIDVISERTGLPPEDVRRHLAGANFESIGVPAWRRNRLSSPTRRDDLGARS
jgi:hypothetical protein